MSIAMISVAPDLLTRLMTLRLSESESLDEVIWRLLVSPTKPAPRPAAQVPTASPVGVTYQLLGETHAASDATEAMINILRGLAQYDDEFFPKLAAKVRGRTRNHVAPSRSGVYPARPNLIRYVKEVSPKWFIGCNIANREKEKILRAACEVMGISFGSDLKIELAPSQTGTST